MAKFGRSKFFTAIGFVNILSSAFFLHNAIRWIFFWVAPPQDRSATVADTIWWASPILTSTFGAIIFLIVYDLCIPAAAKLPSAVLDVIVTGINTITLSLSLDNLVWVMLKGSFGFLDPYPKSGLFDYFVCAFFFPLLIIIPFAALQIWSWFPLATKIEKIGSLSTPELVGAEPIIDMEKEIGLYKTHGFIER